MTQRRHRHPSATIPVGPTDHGQAAERDSSGRSSGDPRPRSPPPDAAPPSSLPFRRSSSRFRDPIMKRNSKADEPIGPSRPVPPLLEECYEILLLVSRAHEGSVMTLYTSGILEVLTLQMPSFPDGSHLMELAMLLIQLIVSKLPEERVYSEHATELSLLVVVIAKQFAMLQNALKFEALDLLSSIMSNKYSAPVHDALSLISNDAWLTNLRIGIVDILQNRVAPTSKFQALVLAECVMSIVGEGWLIGEMNLPNAKNSLPADRCVMLVLESARVEVDVILNELGYLKYEAPKDSLSTAENILVKQRNLGVTFSLLEKVIKFVSSFAEAEEPHMNSIISESTFSKIILGLNKTTDVVLDYLKDAKVHELRKGDDLLASVRIIGSYLAEAPDACREKVIELLDFMLSVEGETEHSPFYSICFLLPMLCQLTVKTPGCKVLTSSGAFRSDLVYVSSFQSAA